MRKVDQLNVIMELLGTFGEVFVLVGGRKKLPLKKWYR